MVVSEDDIFFVFWHFSRVKRFKRGTFQHSENVKMHFPVFMIPQECSKYFLDIWLALMDFILETKNGCLEAIIPILGKLTHMIYNWTFIILLNPLPITHCLAPTTEWSQSSNRTTKNKNSGYMFSGTMPVTFEVTPFQYA